MGSGPSVIVFWSGHPEYVNPYVDEEGDPVLYDTKEGAQKATDNFDQDFYTILPIGLGK